MIETLQVFLLALAIVLSFADVFRLRRKDKLKAGHGEWIHKIARRQGLVVAVVGCATFLGCLVVAGAIHEPVPRVPDEFSYLLMANTFAHGHVTNPSPPLPEFFDTLHVLVRPFYVSKYFPAQGLFLAIGQKLTHHPAVGLWLSSALACAATCWMLQAWAGPVWGLVGGLLVMIQWGVFSYWSQTYWGGMVGVMGGALCLGALRRLWDRLSWSSALWFGLGVVILVNNRPLEGLATVGVAGAAVLYRAWRDQRRPTAGFWRSVVLPAAGVLLLGAAVTAAYNRAITGSTFAPPYLAYERQYQQTPMFIFLPMRPRIGWINPVLRGYYEAWEGGRYLYQRNFFPCSVAWTVGEWRSFYCGILFTVPLVIPVLIRRGWIRYLQLAVSAGLIVLAYSHVTQDNGWCSLIDVLVIVQIVLLWLVFDGFWPRLAISISVLLLVIGFVSKWWFPHYSGPAACLCWFLQIDGLRRIWQWQSKTVAENKYVPNRKRRRAAANDSAGWWSGATLRFGLRNLIYLFPVLCALSLVGRVVLRKYQTSPATTWLDWGTLLVADWSVNRAAMQEWLEQQTGPQLVFVRYEPDHQFASEWVYNDPDLQHSKVVWAHDLGGEHNRLLLQQMPGRNVWSVDADIPDPRLSSYHEEDTVLQNQILTP